MNAIFYFIGFYLLIVCLGNGVPPDKKKHLHNGKKQNHVKSAEANSQRPEVDIFKNSNAMKNVLQGRNGKSNADLEQISPNHILPGAQLRCEPTHGHLSYEISPYIHAKINSIAKYNLQPACPCAFDGQHKCRTHPHMCVASSMKYFCTFQMNNIIVSDYGALIQADTNDAIQFNHPTIAGGKEPMYFPIINSIYLRGMDYAVQKYTADDRRPVHDLVVPVRSRWDDCFNHLSFQSMPMISLTYSFYKHLWHNITWHASR